MADTIDIMFDKLYRYDRIQEPCGVCIPVKKGKLKSTDSVEVIQNNKKVMSQTKVTSRYDDGSVRYMYVRFLADLPGNKGTVLQLNMDGTDLPAANGQGIKLDKTHEGYAVDTGALKFTVKNDSDGIFEYVNDGNREYDRSNFVGPLLKDGEGIQYGVKIGQWKVVEEGDV